MELKPKIDIMIILPTFLFSFFLLLWLRYVVWKQLNFYFLRSERWVHVLEVVVSKNYFIVVNIISYASIFYFLSKMPPISHYNYFARSWGEKAHQLNVSILGILEIVCSKIFKMSISKQDVCINRNLENGHAKVNTDL